MDLFPDSPALTLSKMQPQQWGDIFALLDEKSQATTKDGKPYFRTSFRDARKAATVMIWADSPLFPECEKNWEVGVFYKLRCRYFENNFGPNLEIERIRPVTEEDAKEGFKVSDYLPSSRFDADEMWAELLGFVSTIEDEPLRQLVEAVLTKYEPQAKVYPAASRNHHAYRHGYLEHTLSVVRTAAYLADKYRDYYQEMDPPLSRDLVIAGAVLHDIGKVFELDGGPTGSHYTPAGRLVGHIQIGRDLVRDTASAIDGLAPETQLRLEHIILSHQGIPEWGSPVSPHTPEALLVHFADDIDAKFHMMATLLEQPREDEPFTSRRNPLGRMVFRGEEGE